MDCVFCKIAQNKLPSYKIWEDKNHLAFLGIFPNTPGMCVVIPKKHSSGYAFSLKPKKLAALISAAQKTARLLDKKLGLERTAMIMEGTQIDHAHLKLYPLWSYKKSKNQTFPSYQPAFFKKYQGWLTSKEGPQATPKELQKIYRKIIN
ncbi:MAG: HIT family protein [Patescibacteria group bacterium]|nr:HIT family protein [Patescibacteria group bacterium]